MHAIPVLHPLPDNKLPLVNISPIILEHWKNEAMDAVQDVLHNRQSWHFRFQDHQNQYKAIYTKNNTQGCVRAMKRTKMIEYMSRAELNMTLDELSYGLHCENTAEQRVVYAQLYQDACLDGALLKQFEGRKPDDSFYSVAVKWIAYHSPLNKIIHTRDFVFFEYCFTATDALGRKVLIEYKKSQRFRPDQLHNHDLDITRVNMFTLNTYYTEGNHVVMHSQGNIDVSGSFPAWFAMSVMPIAFDRIRNYHGLVCAKTLADTGITSATLTKQCVEALAACQVCRKRFKLMRGKKWCRGCGHAVCRDCVADVILYKNEIESAPRLPFTRERFCTSCLIPMRVHRTYAWHEFGNVQTCFLATHDSDIEPSRITAAVQSMDNLFDEETYLSRDDSQLTLSISSHGDPNLEGPVQKFMRQYSSQPSSPETGNFSSKDSTISVLSRSICLIEKTRAVAEQAATLRCTYQQECQKWQ